MILYYIIKKQVRAIQIKIKSYIFPTGMKPAICMELLNIFYFPCKINIFVITDCVAVEHIQDDGQHGRGGTHHGVQRAQ